MKVLHILNELKFSGAEIMYVSAAAEFQQLGCELYVVATASNLGEYATYFEKAGYQVLHWPYTTTNYLKIIDYCENAIRYMKEEKIDLVHIHSSTMRWLMAYCALRAGCKSVYTFHNIFPSRTVSYLYHVLQRWSAKKILNCRFQTISDSVYQHEKEYYHNLTTKVYNWYDCNRFFPAVDREKYEIRQQLNIPASALVLISIGGCSPIKRHTDIIKALLPIKKEYADVIYLHLGEGESLVEEQGLAQELGLSENIRFLGNQSNVRSYLIASDIYLMSSRFEGISITTIEALACKIPAILYDVAGLRDFNKTKECSLLIPESPAVLASSVLSLYHDQIKMNQLSSNGKDFVDEYFYMKKNVLKIYQLYSS